MSVTFILIPLALAAVADHKARKGGGEGTDHRVIEIQTRMRDTELLTKALDDLGWTSRLQGTSISATSGGQTVEFTYDEDGALQATFGESSVADQAEAFLRALDDEYTRRVQEAVYNRLKAQAGAAGMAVESERVDDDDAIVVTLRVGD